MMVLVEKVSAKCRSEMAALERRGKLAAQGLALRGLPACQPIAGILGRDNQILNHEITVAQEARARRNRLRRLDEAVFIDLQRPGLAPFVRTRTPGLLAIGLALRGLSLARLFVHAAGLEYRSFFLTLANRELVFEPRELFPKSMVLLEQPFAEALQDTQLRPDSGRQTLLLNVGHYPRFHFGQRAAALLALNRRARSALSACISARASLTLLTSSSANATSSAICGVIASGDIGGTLSLRLRFLMRSAA